MSARPQGDYQRHPLLVRETIGRHSRFNFSALIQIKGKSQKLTTACLRRDQGSLLI